jgi:hypothetical protein
MLPSVFQVSDHAYVHHIQTCRTNATCLFKPGIETTFDSVKGMALRSNHRDQHCTMLFEIFADRSDKRLNTGDGSAKYQA